MRSVFAIFVEQARFAFADIENAATAAAASHAPHQEEPKEHQQDDGQQTAEQAHEELIAFLVFYASLVVSIQKAIDGVDIRVFSRNRRSTSRLVRALFVDFANFFGANHHAHVAFGFIHHHLFGHALFHIVTESGVVHLLVHTARVALVSLVKHDTQANDNDKVHPRQVKSRFLFFSGSDLGDMLGNLGIFGLIHFRKEVSACHIIVSVI